MQFKNILTFVALASAAPLLQVREEGVETVTSWEVKTVTQYTTIWVAPDSVPTTSSSVVVPAAPATPPTPAPAEPTPPAPAPVAPVQPSPVTAVQQAPVQPTLSPPPPQAPVEAPVVAPVETPVVAPVVAPAPAPAPSPSPSPKSAPASIGNSFIVKTLAGASSPNGPCTSSQVCSGDITHYNPSQGVGSCGPKDWATGSIYTDDDMVVAVSWTIMGSISNGGTPDSVNDLCKRSVHIKGQAGGQDVVAKVVDKCAGCSQNFALDLSPAVWAKVAPNGDGRVHDVEWYWV